MRGYGWIFVLVALATVAVGLRFAFLVRESRSHERLGDGKFPSTYGFALDNLTFPRAQLSATPLPKDGLAALAFPGIYTAEKASSFRGRDKYLVPSDLVVGVWVDGHARAYPVQILNWHEVVNDTLGGTPIVVSYAPLAGAGNAYDRRVGTRSDRPDRPDRSSPPNGSNLQSADPDSMVSARVGAPVDAAVASDPLVFGVSGLLWNSHPLLFDRQANPAAESLWSPLRAAPVAGPAVDRGEELRALPAALVPWDLWRTHHPQTTVMARDETQLARYKRKPYVAYFGNDELRFPVTPLPSREDRPWKTPVLIPLVDGADAPGIAFSIPELAEAAGHEPGILEIDGVRVRFETSARPPGALAFDDRTGRPLPTHSCFWFAWYSIHPGGPIR